MQSYCEIVQKILNEGVEKTPYRNREARSVRKTTSIYGWEFRHNMSEGFPLLTTKFVSLKNVATELLFFIQGLTDKKWLRDRGCKIWNGWCNPDKVSFGLPDEVRKEMQLREDDLGPLGYSHNWRRFNQPYLGKVSRPVPPADLRAGDQLNHIIQTLKVTPYDRRMVCSAWNPLQMGSMALPPCHWGWEVNVQDEKLNLKWIQRSVDVPLGLPYNIASYALLLKMLAQVSGLGEGILIGSLGDCHIYNNQYDGVKEQLAREPFGLPEVVLPAMENPITDWDGSFDLRDYEHHPAIRMDVEV